MSGGLVTMERRSAGGVSPDRMPTRTSGSGRPRRTDSWRMPVSGERRLRSTSTARALSGDTYSTRQRFFASAGGGSAARRSSEARKAASVLPEPVGATTKTSLPSPMARQAPSCAAVGALKAPANQLRVAGENASSADPVMLPIVHPGTDNGPVTPPAVARSAGGARPGPARMAP